MWRHMQKKVGVIIIMLYINIVKTCQYIHSILIYVNLFDCAESA